MARVAFFGFLLCGAIAAAYFLSLDFPDGLVIRQSEINRAEKTGQPLPAVIYVPLVRSNAITLEPSRLSVPLQDVTVSEAALKEFREYLFSGTKLEETFSASFGITYTEFVSLWGKM